MPSQARLLPSRVSVYSFTVIHGRPWHSPGCCTLSPLYSFNLELRQRRQEGTPAMKDIRLWGEALNRKSALDFECWVEMSRELSCDHQGLYGAASLWEIWFVFGAVISWSAGLQPFWYMSMQSQVYHRSHRLITGLVVHPKSGSSFAMCYIWIVFSDLKGASYPVHRIVKHFKIIFLAKS